MRVLHLLGERAYAGGEVQLEHVLRALKARGHESRLILQPKAAFAAVADRLAVPYDIVRMRNGFDLLAAHRLRQRIRTSAPDLVHLADARTHKLGSIALRYRPGLPVVVTRRLADTLRKGWFTRWTYRRADAVVAISEATARAVEAVGVASSRIHVIYDGIDPAPFEDLTPERARARQQFDLSDDALVVLSAATMGARKGQAHLVRAFADILQGYPEAVLILAGEGRERPVVENQVRELGITANVRFPGRIDVTHGLAAADVACVPSLMEGLSVFALEAQAAGVPVVASDVGGLSEAIADGQTGVLVAVGEVDPLATALAMLLQHPDRRMKLGAAGRARVHRLFTADAMAAATVSLYERLASSGESADSADEPRR